MKWNGTASIACLILPLSLLLLQQFLYLPYAARHYARDLPDKDSDHSEEAAVKLQLMSLLGYHYGRSVLVERARICPEASVFLAVISACLASIAIFLFKAAALQQMSVTPFMQSLGQKYAPSSTKNSIVLFIINTRIPNAKRPAVMQASLLLFSK